MSGLEEIWQHAVSAHRAGDWPQAEAAYRQLLVAAPDAIEVRHGLSWVLHARGQTAEAIDELRRALAMRPDVAALHNDLGMMLRRAGDDEQAIAAFAEAIRRDPTLWQAHFNLGNAQHQQGQPQEALASYLTAARLAPHDADVQMNLGRAQKDVGQLEAAKASLERALALRPDFADAWSNLGAVHRAAGDPEGAVGCYQRALALDPQNAIVHNNLGMALRAANELSAAVESFQTAIRLDPNYAGAHKNLATAYESQGEADRAIASFGEALEHCGDDALRICAALVLPVVVDSQEEIDARRERLERELAQLAARDLSVDDPVHQIGAPLFALAYHGCNERGTQQKVAEILRRATPELAFVAPHCRGQRRTVGRRIKVGFVSTHFGQHTIGKLNAGLIRHLDRRKFEVFVIRAPRRRDDLGEQIADSADACLTLSSGLTAAQQQIAEAELDLLFYTDIGIAPLTYYLAHARLAPVQCVTWGHPLTTGIPALDYFVSSEQLEVPEADAHYTEQLVRLEHLANYYYRPEESPSTKSREDFDLPGDARVYACLQSLFKLHPDDDRVFAEILRRDPGGRLLLLEGNFPNWTKRYMARFRRSFADVADRVQFISQQAPPDFSRLLSTVDALLDPLHFGGGDTTYQSFAVGAPVVCLPSGFLRGRITHALYRALGIDELLAGNVEDYVAKALRLAHDRPWREQLRTGIASESGAIFENPAGVRDLEAFFVGRFDVT